MRLKPAAGPLSTASLLPALRSLRLPRCHPRPPNPQRSAVINVDDGSIPATLDHARLSTVPNAAAGNHGAPRCPGTPFAARRDNAIAEGRGGGGKRGRGAATDVIIVYPSEGKNRITITQADLAVLGAFEYLNDTIIDFYLKFIELQVLHTGCSDVRSQVFFFSSFFFKKLVSRVQTSQGGSQLDEVDSPPNLIRPVSGGSIHSLSLGLPPPSVDRSLPPAVAGPGRWGRQVWEGHLETQLPAHPDMRGARRSAVPPTFRPPPPSSYSSAPL